MNPQGSLPKAHRLSGLREIAAQYDNFVIDVWGVLHDGVEVFAKARNCLAQLHKLGKNTFLLTNAPRRSQEVAQQLAHLGIPQNSYRCLHSSGEEIWQTLKHRTQSWAQKLGKRCLRIGPERDRNLFNGLDLRFCTQPKDADFILVTGPWNPEDIPAAYDQLLKDAQTHRLPLLCANPDLYVQRGPTLELCAGSIAEAYHQRGGTVFWQGKPYPDVYKRLLDGVQHLPTLAIGDSLYTDIAGAQACGLESLLIVNGVMAESLGAQAGKPLDDHKMRACFDEYKQTPNFLLPDLCW